MNTKTKYLIKFLCMFLVVVMVSVTFLQPIAYAFAVVDDLLLLLIGGLLMICGFTFASTAQLQESAQYCLDNMPTFLTNQLANALLDCALDVTKMYQAMKKGITSVVQIKRDVFAQFREWVIDAFGINEADISNGYLDYGPILGKPARVLPINGGAKLPVYVFKKEYGNIPEKISNGAAIMTASYLSYWVDFTAGGHKFERYLETTGSALSLGTYSFRKDGFHNSYTYSQTFKCALFLNESSMGSIYLRTVGIHPSSGNYYACDVSLGSGMSYALTEPYVEDAPINFSKSAYEHVLPDTVTDINVGLPDTADRLIGRDWTDVLTNYDGVDRYLDPVDTWEWEEALERMREMLENVSGLLNGAEYVQLLEGISSIVGSLQATQDAIAQNIDVITDIRSLVDAMEASEGLLEDIRDWVRDREAAGTQTDTGIQDLLKAREEDAAKIADLQKEITQINDMLKNVTADRNIKINWSILLGIAMFDKFPFSLPKDLHSFFSVLAAPPKEPVFEFDIFGGKFNGAGHVVIDFRQFDRIRLLVRNFTLILLIASLITATKNYIWSGGG